MPHSEAELTKTRKFASCIKPKQIACRKQGEGRS